jgi:hypothetical protein
MAKIKLKQKLNGQKCIFSLYLSGALGPHKDITHIEFRILLFFSFAANSRTALTERIIEVSSLDTNFKTARVISDEQPHWPLRNCSMSVEHEN